MKYEYCCVCGGETGRAGKGDDSIYFGENGPFCEDCADKKQIQMTNIENKIREAYYLADAAYSGNCLGLIPFEKGYLAAHQEAAAQIAERDKEIERLKAELKKVNGAWEISVNFQESTIKRRDEKIKELRNSRAEWKQLAELRLQEMKEVVAEYVQELTAVREREQKAQDCVEIVRSWTNGIVVPHSQMDRAIASYDASRAEKKEGA